MTHPLFDTHAHLDDEQFANDLPGVIARARAAGVENMVAVGTTATSSQRCLEIANTYDAVHAAVGIQPNYVAQAMAGDWARAVQLAAEARCIAIGETGLGGSNGDRSSFRREVILVASKRTKTGNKKRRQEEIAKLDLSPFLSQTGPVPVSVPEAPSLLAIRRIGASLYPERAAWTTGNPMATLPSASGGRDMGRYSSTPSADF